MLQAFTIVRKYSGFVPKKNTVLQAIPPKTSNGITTEHEQYNEDGDNLWYGFIEVLSDYTLDLTL